MGLDMYAYATMTTLDKQVDFPEPFDAAVIFYWRKHPNLHGWMRALYEAKGGEDARFDLSPVALTATDLDALEAVIVAGKLPHTSGFFFGQSDGSEREKDLRFIANAREEISHGNTVFYIAWY